MKKSKDSLSFSSLFTVTEHKPKRDLDVTWFIGAVIDPFEFSILMKEDGTIWKGTGSIEWHRGSKKENEYWDNEDWLSRARDREPAALKLIPKEITKEETEDFINLLKLVTKRGWL